MKAVLGTVIISVETTGDQTNRLQVKESSPFYDQCYHENDQGCPAATYDAFTKAGEKATGAYDVDQGPYWNQFDFRFQADEVDVKKAILVSNKFIEEHFIEITVAQLDEWREENWVKGSYEHD